MKQLINRYDNKVRLIGIEEAREEGQSSGPIARGEKARHEGFIRFKLPTSIGPVDCAWNSKNWMLEDYEEKKGEKEDYEPKKGEKSPFCEKLGKAIKAKGYSAMGLSQALGHSPSWLANILGRRVKLRPKHDTALERELGLAPGTLKKWRR